MPNTLTIRNKVISITTVDGLNLFTVNTVLAEAFWHDGAIVIYAGTTEPVFGELLPHDGSFPVWFTEREKDMLVAHWEKTGMFASVIKKIRSSEVMR